MMDTPICNAVRVGVFALRHTPPSKVRMHIAVQCAIDNEGMNFSSVLIAKASEIEEADLDKLFSMPPRTLAGMPITYDRSMPDDVIIFEDVDGKELARITGLPVVSE